MIKIIWLIFTVLFLLLAVFHYHRSTKSIKKLGKISGAKSIMGVSTGLVEMQAGLNGYVDQLNSDNKTSNKLTAIGYFTTSITALFSFFLSS